MSSSDDQDKNAANPKPTTAKSAAPAATANATPSPLPAKGIMYFQNSADLKRFAKKYRTEISASSSSMLSTFAAFPLDFAKSRMQSYETGFVATMRDAYKAEGMRAFWRGVGPPMLSIMIVRTISFSIYQKAKYALDDSIFKLTGQSPLAHANAPGTFPNMATVGCFGAAGAVAGAIITTISCPFELTKLNEQLAGKMVREAAAKNGLSHGDKNPSVGDIKKILKGKGSFATAKRLVKDRGIQGLYAGYRLHLLRDTIGTAIYFMTYESAKQVLGNARGNSATSPYAVLMAGGLCGVASWACIYPVDVAKTLYQKALLSAGSGHPERPQIKFFHFGSYRGLGVSVMRSCIINMIFFSNFELVKKYINALDVDD